MNENEDGPTVLDNNGSQSSSLSFEQTLSHLAAGYENSQNVVRFLDTKAAAVVGGVPVFLGVCAAVFKWVHEAGFIEIGANAGGLQWIFVGTSFLILALALISLRAAFRALLPRDPGTTEPSVVFPYNSEKFMHRIGVFVNGATKSDVIEDYRRQITRMSEIVEIKLVHVKCSIRFVKHLLTVVLISGGALVLLAVTAAKPPTNDEEHCRCSHVDIDKAAIPNT